MTTRATEGLQRDVVQAEQALGHTLDAIGTRLQPAPSPGSLAGTANRILPVVVVGLVVWRDLRRRAQAQRPAMLGSMIVYEALAAATRSRRRRRRVRSRAPGLAARFRRRRHRLRLPPAEQTVSTVALGLVTGALVRALAPDRPALPPKPARPRRTSFPGTAGPDGSARAARAGTAPASPTDGRRTGKGP